MKDLYNKYWATKKDQPLANKETEASIRRMADVKDGEPLGLFDSGSSSNSLSNSSSGSSTVNCQRLVTPTPTSPAEKESEEVAKTWSSESIATQEGNVRNKGKNPESRIALAHPKATSLSIDTNTKLSSSCVRQEKILQFKSSGIQ